MVIVEVNQIPQRSEITEVPTDDLVKVYKTCLELRDLCEKNDGIGISAVQAGLPWRLFLVKGDGTCPHIKRGEYGYFVNCDYEALTEQRVVSLEGCLSLRSPDGRLRSFHVGRYSIIRLFGFRLIFDSTLKIDAIDYTLLAGQQGIVFQHEADHSFGHERLISNIGKEVFIW